MQFLTDLEFSINKYLHRDAFFINGLSYTYSDLSNSISKIRNSIRNEISATEFNIGVVANDDLETYASIFALWLEGKAYVPLSPEMPVERNENIITQAFLKTIIDSSSSPLFGTIKTIRSKECNSVPVDLHPIEITDESAVYILFTSGTTGQPKGVPISRKNLQGFVDAFHNMKISVDENDRCLQMFELTFDLSVMSYLIPLLHGACVYTIPKDKIKFAYIFELMDEQRLTFALMVPSILHYLRPYFDEIHFPEMKYSLFCGEALPIDITIEWSKCLPNAIIHNVYGPTEDTIFCTSYVFQKEESNKSYNGILSIGKSMLGNKNVIIDEENNVLPFNQIGQLCLGGVQLTTGYWNNEDKNLESFFMIYDKGNQTRFYKTGDLCSMDNEGDLMYIGRLDTQIKIQGFRVELSEIEFHVKSFLDKISIVALAIKDAKGNTEIGLVIESQKIETEALLIYMKMKMPAYMIPKRIEFIEKFMLNSNGKTDRKRLALLFNES